MMPAAKRLALAGSSVIILGIFSYAHAQPVVSLTGPTANSVHAPGANITLSATATAASGYTVSKVEFFRGGTTLIGTDTSSPYSITWSNVPQANYTLTAKVTTIKKNAPNQVATSAPRNIMVTAPPVVTLVSPAGGTTVSGPTFTVTATAADSDGSVSSVRISYEDAVAMDTGFYELNVSPYSATVTIAPGDICCVDSRPYYVYVEALDNQGAWSATYAEIDVPLVGLASPPPNSTYTAPASIPLQANVANPTWVSRVDFYNGNTLVSSATSPPFISSWINAPQGNHTLTARAVYTTHTAESPAINVTVNAPIANLHFIEVDHIDTPRLVSNAASMDVWRWDQQEPFGVNVPDENPAGSGAFDLPLRLPGQYFDKETNLHYNYFRDYEPAIGSYKQSDPIGLSGGINTYAYVSGYPLGRTDRLGLIDDFPVPDYQASKTRCPPNSCQGNCLGTVFNEPLGHVDVIVDVPMIVRHFGEGVSASTTRKNTIYTSLDCTRFWSDGDRIERHVLHEYYHVVHQWGRGMTRTSYLLSFWKKEADANAFADKNLPDYQKCLRQCSGRCAL
jgi:RHS repeat-associated protein